MEASEFAPPKHWVFSEMSEVLDLNFLQSEVKYYISPSHEVMEE